jgi:hypothetical protein
MALDGHDRSDIGLTTVLASEGGLFAHFVH